MTPEIAFIARCDDVIADWHLKRITIDTSYGPVDRCYVGNVFGKEILIVYGRFNGQKVPSGMINYQQNIEAVKNMGCQNLIGTFTVGGIVPERPAGTVYVLGDLVGMGNYDISVNQRTSFHNAEMYQSFCPKLMEMLNKAADKMSFEVIKNAVYVCFHGWPRIETKAELNFYHRMGWDVVGQTCDPEATVARLAGLCYAGVAVQIDDPMHREKAATASTTKNEENSSNIKTYRRNTTALIMQFIKDFSSNKCTHCQHLKRINNSFREFPDYVYE